MSGISRRGFIKTAAVSSVAAAAGACATNQSTETQAVIHRPYDARTRIYMITDIEGAAMISRWNQSRKEESTPELYAVSCKLLTGEVNAAVGGILDAVPGAEVIVWDGHGSGGIDVLDFHEDAKLIARGPIKAPYYLDSTFDAVFFVGQHAMAGTKAAPLCHTYSSKTVEYFKLNGLLVGEFGARSFMAGALGVPVVFISGDDKAVAEAKALVPGIHGAVVKQGLDTELALHLSPQAAQELIRKTAAEAVRDIKNIAPIKMDPPFELEIRVYKDVGIDGYLKEGATKIDERTVVFRADDICKLPHI